MITGFFEQNRGSATVGYVITKNGGVFSYTFDGFDGGLPVKVGNLVKNDPDEFHLNYDHENFTEVFRFDKNDNLTLINAWLPDKGTREDNYTFPDIFEKVSHMGQTILENYNGFDARLGAFTRDFGILERRQLEELRGKLKELNLVWKQKCKEESIWDKVQKILVEQLDERDEQIALEAKFIEDLGVDSLDMVEFTRALEEKCGNEIPDEDTEKPASRNTILIGSILVAQVVAVGCDSDKDNSHTGSDHENKNLPPEQPASTNAPTQPNPTGNPPSNSGDPLQKAIHDQGNLKSALESLHADATFDSEGNLLRLGLDSLPVTDNALPVIAKQTRLRALYLFDTKISDAGLKHLAGLKELKILMLTGSPVTSSGIDQLKMSLPDCVIIP